MKNKQTKNVRGFATANLQIAMLCIVAALAFVLAACPDDEPDNGTHTPTTIVMSFVPMTAGETIDFSPNVSLPTGVSYTVTDNSSPQKSWNSKNGFNGKITASEFYTSAGAVTFTQTFYFNSVEITNTGSKRTVVVSISAFPSVQVGTITSDTGSVTLTY